MSIIKVTKYPIKVGEQLFPRDTRVTVLGASDAMVQEAFPGIQVKAGSDQLAVTFPGVKHTTIVSKSQLY